MNTIRDNEIYRDIFGLTPVELAVVIAVTAAWRIDGSGTMTCDLEEFLDHIEGFGERTSDAPGPLVKRGWLVLVSKRANRGVYAPSKLALQKIDEWMGIAGRTEVA